jgi:dolichyl-diphosphooligosaccharide--protein glycosyltransferase
MRKRAKRRRKSDYEEPKIVAKPSRPIIEKKPIRMKKQLWIAITLIGIFFLVLFLNTYFNFTSEVAFNPEGEGFEKFYLSGPDPYYNLRLVKETYETGIYPHYYERDPLLNYPIGARGARAPLFNMMALGFSRVLSPFMPETEAIGYSMQFIPALFGALIIFVVYFIGKELFNRKAGLIGAFFIAVIPIHLGSGHGSAFALFDHDSFNLLLFFLTFLFLIKSIKEQNRTKSFLYAILGGVPLAGLSMTWVEAHYLYVIIAIYAFVQMFIDIFTNKINSKFFVTASTIMLSGYIIAMPVYTLRPEGFVATTTLYLCLVVVIFGIIYYLFHKLKIPWTLSLPSIISLLAIGLIVIYFSEPLIRQFRFLSPISQLRRAVFGLGIYGNKVSMTIAEANTYEISHTVMSFGPAIYWIGWFGFIYLIYLYYKNQIRREYLFIIVLFLMNIWLSGVAGRFINDMVPLIAMLSGWIVWMFIDWLDYKQMLRNIKSAGGGFHGIRRGVKFLHIFGILFVAFIVVLPNAFIAFDSAVPNTPKLKEDGENYTSFKGYMFNDDSYQGAYGMGIVKEIYWQDAFNWLSEQDLEIEDSTQRPAFISWWDYGFYEVALGGHPTVADNFQDGIPVAANFHTSTSEKEAVSVWIIRLLEGSEIKYGKVTDEVADVLSKYLGEANSATVVSWLEDYTSASSFGAPIGAEYDEETSKQYTVGQQYSINAVYHDIVELLDENLNEDEITWLYHDLQDVTGWSIRYYGVEGYDRQIFNIFAFLSDKSLLMINGIEDDFIELLYNGYELDSEGNKIPGSDKEWEAREILDMDINERSRIAVTGNTQRYKDLYFETMFYKTYIGPAKGESGNKQEFDWQVPCLNMKHFYTEFFSDLSKYPYYGTGKASVVISKYYECAYVNGTVTYKGEPLDCELVVQKNVTYYPDLTAPIDHDKDLINKELGKEEFNLLVGAGAYIQIRRIIGSGSYVYQNITFNGLAGTEYAPITDNEAMRRDGYDYERFLNITIDPANISGYVFNDTDFNDIYNSSIDEPLSDLYVGFFEITNFAEDRVDLDALNATVVRTDENGFYNASDMLPGIYRMIVTDENGFYRHFNDVAINQGDNNYDAVTTKQSNLEGIVYYDENMDEEYSPDDTLITDAEIELIFNGTTIRTTKTDSNGFYSFRSLVSGTLGEQELNPYTIKATKAPEYSFEGEVYPVENETTTFDISIDLTPIKLTGTTKFNNAPLDEVIITFEPDETVVGNTADQESVTSESDGSYEIRLIPGSYNISMKKVINAIDAYTLEEEKIILTIGQEPLTLDFNLEKVSATVSGTTTFEGINIANVTLEFKGERVTPFRINSDETGFYTLELEPYNYTVTANLVVTEDGQNYSYTFTGFLEITTVPDVLTYNIVLAREEDE